MTPPTPLLMVNGLTITIERTDQQGVVSTLKFLGDKGNAAIKGPAILSDLLVLMNLLFLHYVIK